MALRNIVQDGDPILKKKCRPVTKFDDKLTQLIDDMAETMLDADGLGLAGPQVGVMRRVFVALDIRDEEKETEDGENGEIQEEENLIEKVIAFVNPEIVETGTEELAYEGCLSFPGIYGAVKRPDRVKIRAYDRNGEPFTLEAEGLMARCMCHENDHLDGITFDRLSEFFYDPEVPRDLDATIGVNHDSED